MAKTKKNQTKKSKKNNNKKNESLKVNVSKELTKILIVLLVVVTILSSFYLLTVAIVNNDNKEEEKETTIQYDEILAGSSFSMNDSEYLVVYYDFTDSELTDLTSQLYSYTYSGEYRLYKVDMSNSFNKPYVSLAESNSKPNSAKDLLINGPTLIKISDGKAIDYIEGESAIIEYLK